jgi:hypothetical protein
LDPPESRLLLLRNAKLAFLFEQAWLLSSSQQGRYLRICCSRAMEEYSL